MGINMTPTKGDLERAAQCWCDPRVSNRDMAAELAKVFAEKLAATRAEAVKEVLNDLKYMIVEFEKYKHSLLKGRAKRKGKGRGCE